jgi:CDP-6-deoxy-D-xylo-4-hexulose-3-dehydrase
MITIERRQELIKSFLEQVKKEEFIPQFCHNLKSNKDTVYYGGPLYDDDELIEVIDTFLFGKWLASGEKVAKFEKEFSRVINVKYSLMLNSGSSANLVMLAAFKKFYNLQDGDEIIVSVVGFPTTVAPIIQCGFKPVFVDIEFSTLNFGLDKIVEKITKKTKAIILSPVLGNPPNMIILQTICDLHGIALLVDGCDSLGSKWKGKHLAEFGIMSTCSFYAAHHLCAGQGGMISSDNKEVIKLCRSISAWGRDCSCSGVNNLIKNGTCNCRFSQWIKELPYPIDHKYFYTNVGYNLQPLDLQGALGLAQLKKLSLIHEKRKLYKDEIQTIMSNIKGTTFPIWYPEADVSWFGVPIICDSYETKTKLVSYLESNRIQTRNYFAGNILVHDGYKEFGDWKDYPMANQVLERVFFIGCSPTMTKENIKYIREVIEKYELLKKIISYEAK